LKMAQQIEQLRARLGRVARRSRFENELGFHMDEPDSLAECMLQSIRAPRTDGATGLSRLNPLITGRAQ
jgi:PleD family two-component response regulator